MVDFRFYLELEAALYRKLRRAWLPIASEVFAEISDLLDKGEFDAATQKAHNIDLSGIRKTCSQYVKYTLQSCINFGGAMAKGNAVGKPFVSAVNHEALLDKVTHNFMLLVEYNVADAVRQSALQSIARIREESATQKAEKIRYVKEFTSFQKDGNERLQLIASLHSSRLSTWGFAAECEVMGITEYQLTAVLDGRTSEFCRAINGKTFQVADARSFVNTVLQVEDPNDLKNIQPWPKQHREAIEQFKKSTPAELTALGLHIPPFHPLCRTLCTRKEFAPQIQMKELPDSEQIIPKSQATKDIFDQLGVPVRPEDIDHWNAFVGLSPAKVLSKLANVETKDLFDTKIGKGIAFEKNGDISFSLHKKIPDAKIGSYAMKLQYDPYMGVLSNTKTILVDATPLEAVNFLKNMYASMVEVGTSVGAKKLGVAATSPTISTYTTMGFEPSPIDWFNLKSSIKEGIFEGKYPALSKLAPDQMQLVSDLLSSRNEGALGALLALPFRVGGVTVGEYLLGEINLNLYLSLDKASAVAAIKEASK